MNDGLIVGTDTAAGKTTLSLVWLTGLPEFDYWKPVETGDSDSELVAELVPGVRVHPPLARYTDAVAPALAAVRMNRQPPTVADILAARPSSDPNRHLLIETFGSVLSPINDRELQVQLIGALRVPIILVTTSSVGAIGRTLQGITALAANQLAPAAVVLIGPHDRYAGDQIRRHAAIERVFSIEGPREYSASAIADAAHRQAATLNELKRAIARSDRAPTGAGAIVARDRKSVWHPYTSLGDPDDPLVVVDAKDEFLTLADGRQLIDGISSWWTILHGHRHPVLMRALSDAATRYDHVHFAGVTHEPAVELAELMLGSMPWPGGRVFFSDNGSTAVEVALKMAYQYWCHRGEPGRTCFVGFEGGYHGDTFGAMAVGRDPLFFGQFEPLLFRAERLPVSADRLADFLSSRRGQVAAVILEPLVQGAGGMRMHTPGELQDIFQVTREHDVLFIADEVMTGGGRTGELWAHRKANICPDLVCAGKTIAGGVLPIAATLAAPPLVAAYDTPDRTRTFFHGHSFTAHPIACSVGVANWRMLRAGLGPAPAAIERVWLDRLTKLNDQPAVHAVRVCGTIAAVEFQTPGGYLSEIGRRLRQQCTDRGVLLRPLGNVLYAMPPLCTSPQSLESIAMAIEHACSIANGLS